MEHCWCFILCIIVLCVERTTAQAGLDRPCTRDTDCIATGSKCTDGFCSCVQGFVQAEYPPRCLPIPQSMNDPCEDDLQCTEAFTLGSYCSGSKRCDCHPQYYFRDGWCMQRGTVGITDRCSQDSECTVQGSYCKDHLACACSEDKVASKDHRRCLHLAQNVGDNCEEDIQCTENLLLGAQCKNGACQCRSDHHYANLHNSNGCYKTKKIGEICNELKECTSKPDPLRVTCDNVCTCTKPFSPSADKTLCNSGAMLGGLLALVAASLLAKFVQ